MKHKFRKPLSLILSLAIIISMGFPAYATEGDSVPNPSGETITEPETPPESPADPEPGDSSGEPDLPENPDSLNPEESENLPSADDPPADDSPDDPADPAEPISPSPESPESPEETPADTPSTDSGEAGPSINNDQITPPIFYQSGGRANHPGGGRGHRNRDASRPGALHTPHGAYGGLRLYTGG